jgi:ribosomal protein S18 acetylase RimI-like enzyme
LCISGAIDGREKSRPELCFLCFSQPDDDDDDDDGHPPRAIGAVVCKQDVHRGKLNRGYIAMLTTKKEARKRGIGKCGSLSPPPFFASYLTSVSFSTGF